MELRSYGVKPYAEELRSMLRSYGVKELRS